MLTRFVNGRTLRRRSFRCPIDEASRQHVRLVPGPGWTHRRRGWNRWDDRMVTMRRMLIIVACLGAFAAPASAQPADSNVLSGGGGPMVRKPKPGVPEVK